jgi:hypothetical protein
MVLTGLSRGRILGWPLRVSQAAPSTAARLCFNNVAASWWSDHWRYAVALVLGAAVLVRVLLSLQMLSRLCPIALLFPCSLSEQRRFDTQ